MWLKEYHVTIQNKLEIAMVHVHIKVNAGLLAANQIYIWRFAIDHVIFDLACPHDYFIKPL